MAGVEPVTLSSVPGAAPMVAVESAVEAPSAATVASRRPPEAP
jgi:hypothetical protein